MKRKSYFSNLSISFSQSLNTLLGGYPIESLSSRAYKNQNVYFWHIIRTFIDALFFFEKKHCEKTYFKDLERANFMLKNYEQRFDNK